MTTGTPVTVTMSGSGKAYETVVQPGQTPREVLAQTLGKNPEQYLLRAGTTRLSDIQDVFRQVNKGDELIAATDPVVG